LPALQSPVVTKRTFGADSGGAELLLPRLSPADVVRQTEALVAARAAHLEGRPISEIIRIVARAAVRFRDRSDPLRQMADDLLPRVTGMAPEMTSLVLERMAADWDASRLERLLVAELG